MEGQEREEKQSKGISEGEESEKCYKGEKIIKQRMTLAEYL